MSTPSDPTRDQQLIKLAQRRVRLSVRRSKLQKQLDQLDAEIREVSNLLRSMITPARELPEGVGDFLTRPDERRDA